MKEDIKNKEGQGFTMKESSPQDDFKLDFSTFILSLATGALIHMGVAPDPNTQETHKNIELAKQNIELLGLLKDKTKGNLSDAENQLLENILTEVRLRFVEASK